MTARKTSINATGIMRQINGYEYKKSIIEYIENGLDAGARNISIEYKKSGLGVIESISIEDDGGGINYAQIDEKFGVVLSSQKKKLKNLSDTSGKDGIGRLTFYSFANNAEWKTIYKEDDGTLKTYSITIKKESLDGYDPEEPQDVKGDKKTGTKVIFTGIIDDDISEHTIQGELQQEIIEKISWRFILLNAKLTINGEEVDFSQMIQYEENKVKEIEGKHFNARIIKWSEKQKEEASSYYFVDSEGNEKYKTTTGKNRQGDDFNHSVYVTSEYFDHFTFNPKEKEEKDKGNMKMDLDDKTNPNPKHPVFKELVEYLNEEVRLIRKPFIAKEAKVFLEEVEREGIIEPGETVVSKAIFEETKDILEGIYLYSPKFLKTQNDEQKAVFVKLIHTVIAEGKSSSIFNILDHVLQLTPEERDQFAKILQDVSLSNIIKTIKLIEDRFDVIKVLEQFVYNETLGADEVHDLQGIIAEHYWLFGEEFTFLSEAEPSIEECLNRYAHLRYGYATERKHMESGDKEKELDLFISKTERSSSGGEPQVKNVVVEIKHPSKNINTANHTQVLTYMTAILSEPMFSGKGVSWKYFLIGKQHNDYIDGVLRSGAIYGRSIIHRDPENDITIYYKDWSEIIDENKTRLEYLRQRLELKQETIHKNSLIKSKEEGKEKLDNSASLEHEFKYEK